MNVNVVMEPQKTGAVHRHRLLSYQYNVFLVGLFMVHNNVLTARQVVRMVNDASDGLERNTPRRIFPCYSLENGSAVILQNYKYPTYLKITSPSSTLC